MQKVYSVHPTQITWYCPKALQIWQASRIKRLWVLDTVEDKDLEVFISAPIRKGHLRCTVLNNPTATPLLVKFKITLLLVLSSIGMATFCLSVVRHFACSAPTAPTNLTHLRAYYGILINGVQIIVWNGTMRWVVGVTSTKVTFICSKWVKSHP